LIIWLGNLLNTPVHRGLIWIGDHSYTVYLVHWPVIVFYKYIYVEEQISAIIGKFFEVLLMVHNEFSCCFDYPCTCNNCFD
jgi:peptidoglycan/LPS O-acetylase OafA/YrhL